MMIKIDGEEAQIPTTEDSRLSFYGEYPPALAGDNFPGLREQKLKFCINVLESQVNAPRECPSCNKTIMFTDQARNDTVHGIKLLKELLQALA